MAEEEGMIDPFEPGQVRSKDGNRLFSYGTSSYGYDVRCSREFKVFATLPAKIYANEGVAQMLFESDEVCETSYADRGGKYQGQTGDPA